MSTPCCICRHGHALHTHTHADIAVVHQFALRNMLTHRSRAYSRNKWKNSVAVSFTLIKEGSACFRSPCTLRCCIMSENTPCFSKNIIIFWFDLKWKLTATLHTPVYHLQSAVWHLSSLCACVCVYSGRGGGGSSSHAHAFFVPQHLQTFHMISFTECVAFLADGCSLGSAVHSVTIALRHFALGVDPTAAYWDFDLLDGHGGWRAEGCHITGSGGNTTTIHCTHHNNFAVLMVSSLLCGTGVIHFSFFLFFTMTPLPPTTT